MGQGMRVYGSTFLWFIPFVRSIMELTVLNSICIGEVVHYLDNNVNKDVLSGRTRTCDKVTEFFIRILVDIIQLHLSEGCMVVLSYFTHIWVDMVMQCATLSADICNTRIQDRMGVCSTSLHLARGTWMPADGVGAMIQACMKLIHTLLKEGRRTGTVPESAPFLDLINRHLRGVSARGWNLPKSEYENLKKCLLKLVKAISEKPEVSNVLPCAPPTPPSDPSENVISYPNATTTPPLQQLQNKDAAVGPGGPVGTINSIKDEPLWDQEECQSFCDGHEQIIKAKKEPCNPIPISELRPPLEVARMKPDLGKMQEIKSLLKDQSLSKIQAIAKGRFETKGEQGTCTGLKETGNASGVSPQPSTSQSKIPDSAKLGKILNDEDESLDVQRRCLKRSLKSTDEDSTDVRQVSMQLPRSAKGVHETNIITISADISSSDEKLLENKVTGNPSLDMESSKSPGRDFDELSESQVFEFETQDYMASAWNEPRVDIPVVTKKQKLGNDSKACISHDALEPMGTQPVSDKDIDKVCLQVEAQIHKRQQPQEPIVPTMQVPSKESSNERCDFIQSKHSKSPPEKVDLTDKGKQWLSRKPPVIEAPSQKIKTHRRSHHGISPDPVKPCSSTMLASSSVASPSTLAPSRDPSASSVARTATPAIVPPKKVRKRVEPESAAELLGLKKKKRKAFEFSQRSLVVLDELRSHGKNVHVEPEQKSKRVHQQKVGVKKGKKLLASQDWQYFRQSRGMVQKARPATAVAAKSNKYPVSDTLPKSKPTSEIVEEPSDEEEDDFLPCSQPDPERRVDSKMDTGQVITSLSDDSKKAINDCVESIKSREFSSLQNNEGGSGSMAEGAESRSENCGGSDDEWTCLTQNEPTDMELCSQVEQMEAEYGEHLIDTGCVPMDNGSGNQANVSEGETSVQLKPLSGNAPQKSLLDASSETSSDDHLFSKPSMPTEHQKKAKPSTTKIYTSSSRSASLAKEMEKIANPVPAANVAKVKVARPPPVMLPPPAMLPPPPPKSTPQHEFCQPFPPRPTLHSPNQASPSPFNVTPASHAPSYKTYPRPETPVSVQMPTMGQDQRAESEMFEEPYLIQAILKWEYCMFDNYKMFGIPGHLCPFPLKEVPVKFFNYQEYFNIFYPLLLINTFEEVRLIFIYLLIKTLFFFMHCQ